MRDIGIFYLITTIVFYWVITLLSGAAFRQMARRLKKSWYQSFVILYCLWGLILTTSFIVLFIYPFQAAKATYYLPYFTLNTLLITDFLIKLPFIPAGLICIIRRNWTPVSMFLGSAVLSLGFLILLVCSYLTGSRVLSVQKIEVQFASLSEKLDGLRVVHVSDFHLGSFKNGSLIEKAAEVNRKFDPDVVVFTGDLVNNFSYETTGWIARISMFSARYGKFGILGNHDYGNYLKWRSAEENAKNFDAILQAFHESGFHLLRNEAAKVIKDSCSFWVVGVENWGHAPFPQYADLEKAEAGIPDNAFRILLTHDPAHWQAEIRHDKRYPLTLSGHSHGLQWGIKLAGIEFSMAGIVQKYWGGLYCYDERFLYVNRGLGLIAMLLRVDMPAEITLITLRKR